MTMLLSDEKKRSKADQDQRIEKIEKYQTTISAASRKEEIFDMGIWMKNAGNAGLGVKEASADDDPRWRVLKAMADYEK